MTFTATFPIGYAPGSPRELYIEDEPLVVEFDADVRVEWDKSVGQGGCDVDNVDIESAMLGVECWMCDGKGWWNSAFTRLQFTCTKCIKGIGQSDILPTLSAPDLTRLKEDCAEWAREHAVEQQANS